MIGEESEPAPVQLKAVLSLPRALEDREDDSPNHQVAQHPEEQHNHSSCDDNIFWWFLVEKIFSHGLDVTWFSDVRNYIWSG